jgi:hypothetical protein
MAGKSWRVFAVAALFAVAVLCSARAEEVKKAADEAKAEDFKDKTFKLKEKGKGHVTLVFPAGKTFAITVKGGKADVNLFIYAGKKVVAKDDSPGPECDLKFTPKAAGTYTLEVVNLGPGDNRCTLKVELKGKSD